VSLDLDKLMEIRDKLKHLDFQQLQIIGHADDTGTSDINLWLSQKRAEWIKSFLVESGIPDNKLTVVARGSEDPVSLEKTEQARALNRRVVFVFRQEEQVPR
jgi:OOP family OmpA-OmpF porin